MDKQPCECQLLCHSLAVKEYGRYCKIAEHEALRQERDRADSRLERFKREDAERAETIRGLVPDYMRLWPPLDAIRMLTLEYEKARREAVAFTSLSDLVERGWASVEGSASGVLIIELTACQRGEKLTKAKTLLAAVEQAIAKEKES